MVVIDKGDPRKEVTLRNRRQKGTLVMLPRNWFAKC